MVILLRNHTSELASNGAAVWYPERPMKYCGYRFSVNCSTSSLSEYWNLFWMIREPRASRRGFATLPVSLWNREAYFSSNISHETLSASYTQRFSGFMLRPKGWLKSRNDGWFLSGILYIASPVSYRKCAEKMVCYNFISCNYYSRKWLKGQYLQCVWTCSADTN